MKAFQTIKLSIRNIRHFNFLYYHLFTPPTFTVQAHDNVTKPTAELLTSSKASTSFPQLPRQRRPQCVRVFVQSVDVLILSVCQSHKRLKHVSFMFTEDSFRNASRQLHLVHLSVTHTTSQLTDSIATTTANKNVEENWQTASATAVKNKIELAQSSERRIHIKKK